MCAHGARANNFSVYINFFFFFGCVRVRGRTTFVKWRDWEWKNENKQTNAFEKLMLQNVRCRECELWRSPTAARLLSSLALGITINMQQSVFNARISQPEMKENAKRTPDCEVAAAVTAAGMHIRVLKIHFLWIYHLYLSGSPQPIRTHAHSQQNEWSEIPQPIKHRTTPHTCVCNMIRFSRTDPCPLLMVQLFCALMLTNSW